MNLNYRILVVAVKPNDCENTVSAGDNFAARTNLAVSSIEFYQCTFDERDIRRGVGGGSGHG
jgi:hypothetical protein